MYDWTDGAYVEGISLVQYFQVFAKNIFVEAKPYFWLVIKTDYLKQSSISESVSKILISEYWISEFWPQNCFL